MKKTLILSCCLWAISGFAQTKLTLEEAFQASLKSNYGILIQQNNQEIADNAATKGNAGLLPRVELNASYGGNVTDTKLEFAGEIPPTDQKNALSQNANAGATVSYVIFQGLSAQHTYKSLMLNAASIKTQSRAQIEMTLIEVAMAYYDLARAIESESIALSSVKISAQRYERAKLSNELGTSLRTDLLSAQVDLTADSSALMTAQLQRDNAQHSLELVTGLRYSGRIETAEVELELKDWSLDQLVAEARQNNASLKNAELQLEIAKKDYDISKSSVFPTLSVSGGYQYNYQQSEAGIVLSNTQSGWNGAVSLSYPIFTGFRNRTARQNSKIMMETSELLRANEELVLQTELAQAWNTYSQSIRTYDFEVKNLTSAELNLLRNKELYEVGQITNTQFREAQLAFNKAKQRIINAAITIKLNELKIMQLTGQVLKKQSGG